jgi:hypothetical protein
MRQTYRYIGPKKIGARAPAAPAGIRVESPEDVLRWVRQTGQESTPAKNVTATFVIDETGSLRIADRRSEHVACAGGQPVKSAGEMTFTVVAKRVSVTWVTNQSTGYCPEPDSWPEVKGALSRAGIPAPDGFSLAFVFRRCQHCGFINLVKDEVFECGVCSTPLPAKWNLDPEVAAKPTATN